MNACLAKKVYTEMNEWNHVSTVLIALALLPIILSKLNLTLSSRCKLYHAYNINNQYVLNMIKFDSVHNIKPSELKGLTKSESFFGPFFDSKKTSLFFFSLVRPISYDVERYQYESSTGNLEEGHVFALLPETNEHQHVSLLKEPIRTSTHYIKKNIGSKLEKIDLSNWSKGAITLIYSEGDACGNTRYSSYVTLECETTAPSFSRVEVSTKIDRIFRLSYLL